MPKYNYKKDAFTDYFKGKLSAKELDKIARDDFKSGIATKKELSNFLSNKFTQDVMSDTYGIPAGTLVKRVRRLMKFAEGVNEMDPHYPVVSKDDEEEVTESKFAKKPEVTPKQLLKIQNDIKKVNRKIKVYISKHPVTKGELSIELGHGHDNDAEIDKIYSILKKHTGSYRTGSLFNESVNEAGVNVWYFYKKANKDKNKFFKMLSDFRKKHSDTEWIKMLNYALEDFNEKPTKYKTIDDKQNILFKNLQTNKKAYESVIEEKMDLFVEENVPTDPSKWSYYKAQAKKKFDVYPSAYANGWAAKKYKAAGGGWKKKK